MERLNVIKRSLFMVKQVFPMLFSAVLCFSSFTVDACENRDREKYLGLEQISKQTIVSDFLLGKYDLSEPVYQLSKSELYLLNKGCISPTSPRLVSRLVDRKKIRSSDDLVVFANVLLEHLVEQRTGFTPEPLTDLKRTEFLVVEK